MQMMDFALFGRTNQISVKQMLTNQKLDTRVGHSCGLTSTFQNACWDWYRGERSPFRKTAEQKVDNVYQDKTACLYIKRLTMFWMYRRFVFVFPFSDATQIVKSDNKQ